MRATRHSGRMGSAKHNDRTFESEYKRYDEDLTPLNEYWRWNGNDNMTFEECERAFYEVHFEDFMKDINARAEKSRHLERQVDADKLLRSKKTCPDEVIFQIGNMKEEHEVSFKELKAVYDDYCKWHDEEFGKHVKRLDYALHLDETTPHIHERDVWCYIDKNGNLAIGQNKALEQMGRYNLPDGSKERSRHNNLKMQYTKECREKWLEICKEHNLEIEIEPLQKAPNEQNLATNDFIIRKQEEMIDALKSEIKELQGMIEAQEKEHIQVFTTQVGLKEQNEKLKQQNITLINAQTSGIDELMKTIDLLIDASDGERELVRNAMKSVTEKTIASGDINKFKDFSDDAARSIVRVKERTIERD